MSTPLARSMDQMADTERVASALARIIDDPMIVKLLMVRDPQAWAEACEALSSVGYEPEDLSDAELEMEAQAARPDDGREGGGAG